MEAGVYLYLQQFGTLCELFLINGSNELYISIVGCFRSRSRKIIENICSNFKIQIEVIFYFFTMYK